VDHEETSVGGKKIISGVKRKICGHLKRRKKAPRLSVLAESRGWELPFNDLSAEIPWGLPQQAYGDLGLKSPFSMSSRIGQILATSQ
jgi:hypothetical protein